jgi:hypothetical protein
MENVELILTALGKLEPLQAALLLIAALSWFGGGNYLQQKHRARLESEGVEYSANLRLELITSKEWVIFVLHLAFTFSLLISAIMVTNAS